MGLIRGLKNLIRDESGIVVTIIAGTVVITVIIIVIISGGTLSCFIF